MDRGRSQTLHRDGLTVSAMMERVKELLRNAEALVTLGSLGGAAPDERNPAVLRSWALAFVKPFVDPTRSTVLGYGDFLNGSGKYNEPRSFPWDRFM